MPYRVEKSGDGYRVKGPGGKTYSKKPQSLGRARSQLRALYANEGGYGNPNQDGHYQNGHSSESYNRGHS